MIYKTLHWYIGKELLRVFFLTASALTTLMAFGGTLKPLTKQGLDILQLMAIVMDTMPAMLAYSIPLAALFAAVLVYWRLSTDNEIVACRASGISFGTIVLPALALGVVISLTDFVFVNYVVPVFAQRIEQLVRKDLGSVLAFNISHQEAFRFNKLVVYADSAQMLHTHEGGVNHSTVVLSGMAATPLNKDGKPSAIVVAHQAFVHFDDVPNKDIVAVWVQLVDGAAYHPVTFRKMGGTIERLPPDQPFLIPSQTNYRPKFANLRELADLIDNPNLNPDIATALGKMSQKYRFQQVARRYNEAIAGLPRQDRVLHMDIDSDNYILVHIPQAVLSSEQALSFVRSGNEPVQVDMCRGNTKRATYRCDSAVLQLSDEDYPAAHIAGSLELHGTPVLRKDWVMDVPESAVEQMVSIQSLVIPPAMTPPVEEFTVPKMEQLSAAGKFTPGVMNMMAEVQAKIRELFRLIESEKHSRGSFALSCLTLVLLGAALGILLRGRNPLAVFVVGVVPAIVLVLLITLGRRLAELNDHSASQGYMIIWAGNVILVLMVVSVYAKLLRQ